MHNHREEIKSCIWGDRALVLPLCVISPLLHTYPKTVQKQAESTASTYYCQTDNFDFSGNLQISKMFLTAPN